jgi:hypothetical protein
VPRSHEQFEKELGMNASTRALWIASVIAAACFGSVVGTVVAERPAVAAPVVPIVQDPALTTLLKGIKVDEAGNVTLAGSGGNVMIKGSGVIISGSSVKVIGDSDLQLTSGGLGVLKAAGGLTVNGGATTAISGSVVTICCPQR